LPSGDGTISVAFSDWKWTISSPPESGESGPPIPTLTRTALPCRESLTKIRLPVESNEGSVPPSRTSFGTDEPSTGTT
jgi:hypothetical protein